MNIQTMNQLGEDYKKEKLTIDLVWANIFGVLLIIPILLTFGIPYYLIWKDELAANGLKDQLNTMIPEFMGSGALMYLLIIIFGTVMHELIHGLTWSRFTEKGFQSIKFGVLWKMLTPYCHCKEPLRVKHYIFGGITPAIILGIVPAIISIVIGNLGLLAFGMFLTLGACGDFLIVNLLRKENMEDWVQDHPSEAGCFIYRKIIATPIHIQQSEAGIDKAKIDRMVESSM